MRIVAFARRALALALGLGMIADAQEARTTVLARGPNHTVVQRLQIVPGPGRESTVRTNTWIQLEDGLNYWDAERRAWVPSEEVIELTRTGAMAVRGPHRAIFSSNVNDPAGALDLEMDGGIRLRSSVLALRYYDPVAGRSETLATAQDAPGEWLPPNQVIYRNAFEGVAADVVYTYRKRGLEADVVLREVPPSPDAFGLPAATTRLEVVTEFFDAPEPARRERLLATVLDRSVRARLAQPDWVDQELHFGGPRIGEGRAFAWSAREAAMTRPEDFPPVAKEWVRTPDRRTFLIESVELVPLLEDLLALPGRPERVRAWEDLRQRESDWAALNPAERRSLRFAQAVGPAATRGPDLAGSTRRFPARRVPSPGVAQVAEGPLRLAVASPAAPGLVIDWSTLGAGTADFTFSATNTYHVTGDCWFSGTTVIEGGTVVKFQAHSPVNYSSITVMGPVQCRTGAYRPAIFTADTDDSVGETLAAGPPSPTLDYGWMALRFYDTGNPIQLQHLRVKHAYHGVYFQGNNPANTIRHAQFVQCRYPVVNTTSSPVWLQNVLIDGARSPGAALYGLGTPFAGEHLTIHNTANLVLGGTLGLTNSLIVAVGTVQGYSGPGNAQLASAAGVFEATGAGAFYLPSGSPHRDAGSIAIQPALATDLYGMTTVAPIVLNADITTDTILASRSLGDANQPDRGYHYAPLDYAVSGRSITNIQLRLTDGVALAVHGASGLILGQGARLWSDGDPLLPNRLVHHALVQEQSTSLWTRPAGDLGLIELQVGAGTPAPEIRLEGTVASMPAEGPTRRRLVRQPDVGAMSLRVVDSELRGLALTVDGLVAGTSLALTNNLLEDCLVAVSQSAAPGRYAVAFRAFNNYVRSGHLNLFSDRTDSLWSVQDNLLDAAGLSVSVVSGSLSHNGFRAGLTAFGSNNRTDLVLDFVPSALGPFTYPTSGTATSLASLLNAGSRLATVAGLEGYTVRSDGLPETNSVVDIGLHYRVPDPLRTGLVAWWTLDETSGLLAQESSGNGFTGTLVNGPQWVSGVVSNGLSFDGLDDRVEVPDAPDLRLNGALTIAFWVRKTAESTDWMRYVGKGAATARNFGVWDWAGSSGRVFFQVQNLTGALPALSSTTELALNQWYHVACTWDGTTARIYIDGVLDASGPMAGPLQASADPVTFGFAGYNAHFAGSLDEVRLYDRALSAAEIVVVRDYTPPPPPPPGTGLVGSWRLDETVDTQILDDSGNGLHGSLLNGAQRVTGVSTNAVAFDGINDLAVIPDAPQLRLTTGMTVAFWVRKSAESSDWVRYVGKGSAMARNFGVWDWMGTSGRVFFQFQNEAGAMPAVGGVRDLLLDRWYHVACTWDGTTGRIYIDGTLDASAPMAGPPRTSADPLTLGDAGYLGRLTGTLDEVRLFDHALDAAEVLALSQETQPPAPPDGLVASWQLDETGGLQALDTSGNGLHGTLVNGPQRVPGVRNNALAFDGVNDRVDVPSDRLLHLTNALSVAFWTRKSAEHADWVRYVGKGAASVRTFGVWDSPGASGRVLFQYQNVAGGYPSLTSSREILLDRWQHVVCTWDGATGRIYIDGTLDVSGPMSGLPRTSADPLTLGYAGYYGHLAGILDEVRVYQRVLSAGEVQTLMVNTMPPPPAGGLVGSWTLNEASGTQALDDSGNGFHGTLLNGPQRVTGVSGIALDFDGLDDRVSVPDGLGLRLTQALSVAFWVRKDAEAADWVRYVGKGGPVARNFGVWDPPGSSGRVLFQYQNVAGSFPSLNSVRELATGQWYHVACTWDGSTGRIYIDGTLDATGPMTGVPRTSADPLTFGDAGYYSRLNGALDEVRLFDRALSAEEVLLLSTGAPPDSDYDGRTDAQELADGTDPNDPDSVKPVELAFWYFSTAVDTWRASNGALPLEQTAVLVPLAPPNYYAAELSQPSHVLRYRDVETSGAANINTRQGYLILPYAPNWASDSPDCPTGTRGTGPGTTVELLSVGAFSLAIDPRGTNLMFRTPDGLGGSVTNLEVPLRACAGDYTGFLPLEIGLSYSPEASAIFFDGFLQGRGSGVAHVPSVADRVGGLFIGSNPQRSGQMQGLVSLLRTYNTPLNLYTNPLYLSATFTEVPPSISLHWIGVSNCSYRIDRRQLPDTSWTRIGLGKAPTFTDTGVVVGQEYEYRLSPNIGVPAPLFSQTDPAYVTVRAGIRLVPDEAPGRLVLVTDQTLGGNPTFEAAANGLIRDLWSEGWVVHRLQAPRHDDAVWANNPSRISSIKTQIASYRNLHPTDTRAVLLLGHLAIPRSGELSPDGHQYRPLSADVYYGDLDGLWTDATNWLANPPVAVANLPGDGIFDQEVVPPNPSGLAAVELAVSRVDFARLPTFANATPPRDEVTLLAQYVEKARRFRRREAPLPEAVIYGAYFGTDAVSDALHPYHHSMGRFAQRMRIPYVGVNLPTLTKSDFLSAQTPAVWGILGGYGNGPGGIHIPGFAATIYYGLTPHVIADLLTPAGEPPIAFSLTEASFACQWEETDHFGRGLLATANHGLGWMYSGTPRAEWQTSIMALGRTLGDAWLKTQNDAWMWPMISVLRNSPLGTGVKHFTGQPSQGGYIYAALLGDPTLRQAPATPPGTLNGTVNGSGQVALTWGASPDPGVTYHVYRTTGTPGSAWTRLTSTPLATTTFTDTTPPAPPRTYMVRALTLKTIVSGSYTNLSAGSLWP